MGTIVYRGVGPSGAPSEDVLLAELVFANTHASVATPSEGYVTFGMAFKKGDVPDSKVPKLRGSNSIISAQFDLRNTWPDGSLRWCEVSCIVPSISGGGTLAVEVWSGKGSYNNTASRVVTDVTASTDFKVAITNATDYLGSAYNSGTLTAAFSSATPELVKSGPVCCQWRGWTTFETQTVDHLAAWFYVTAWTKPSDGTLGPISHIAKVHNGFISLTGPTKYFYDCSYKNGASTIRQFDVDKTFTVLSQPNNTLTCTAHGRQTGDPVTVSTTTTLPAGLTAGTVYYVSKVDDNTVVLNTSGPTSLFNSGQVDITSNGTGTHTLEFRIFHHCHSSWWSADTDGLSDWTASEATIVVKPDKAYLKSTGLIPPYNTSITPTTATLTAGLYTPNCWAGTGAPVAFSGTAYGVNLSIGNAGGSSMRGWLPQWAVEAFLTQDLGFIKHTRVQALIQSSMPHQFINEVTGRIPTLRGNAMPFGDSGDYTGLGTNKKDTSYYSNVNKTADVPSVDGDTGPWNVDAAADWAHMPQLMHYTIITEGGAHLIDAQLVQTNHSVMWPNASAGGTGYEAWQRIQRVTSGDSFYYGIYNHGAESAGPSNRQIGWTTLMMSYLYSVLPDDWDEKQYISDLMVSNATYANDVIAAAGANFQANGCWQFNLDYLYANQFMHNFLCGGVAQAYKITEDNEILGWIDHLKKFRINAADGSVPCVLSALNQYQAVYDAGGNVDGSTNFSAVANVGFTLDDGFGSFVHFTVTDLVNNVCTLGASSQWDVHTDDRVRISGNQGGSNVVQSIPGGLTQDTWYYCVNVSGRTFKLSLTPSPGSAINITSLGGDGSNEIDGIWRPATCPTSIVVTNADNYFCISISAVSFMAACGISGTATPFATMSALTGSMAYEDCPLWATTDSF